MNPSIASLLVILCGILRSTDLYFRNSMVKALPVIVLISWEHMVNLALLLPLLFTKAKEFRKLGIKDLLLFIMVGCGASAMGILCFSEAFHYINPALAVLLQKLQPIITILLGTILLKEKITGRFFGWALLAIICSYFVSFGLTDPFTGEWKKIASGAAYAMLAAFFWGGGTIWGKMLLQKFDQSFVLAGRFLLGTVFTVSMAFIFKGGLHADAIFSQKAPLYGSIFYMAVISGILATSFFYAGLKWVKASQASILELFFPVSSVVIMWLSFNRPITPIQIVAGIIMFFAVYKINQTTDKKV